jgi:hypothetical protein
MLARRDTRAQAEDLERAGHKQLYWVTEAADR